MPYGRFFAMIATSTIVMFGLMYLNTYSWTHVFYSETRTYMALLMGATMAIVMLAFMYSMYPNAKINLSIFAGSMIVFAASLWLVRSQATVGDVSFMRAMIPHHSIAVMTSRRANVADPRVRKLADEIISAQEKEIAEMRFLIADLSGQDVPAVSTPASPTPTGHGTAELGTVSQALSRAELTKLDAEAMSPAEVRSGLSNEADCEFRRTTDSRPILATAGSGGLMKLNGRLIRLTDATGHGGRYPAMVADGISMRVQPLAGAGDQDDPREGLVQADLLFDLEARLAVGYRGYVACGGA